MPIKGLTDQGIMRFPRLGIIHKGAPKDDAGRMGKDLDYFRFTSERPEVLEAFNRIFGDKPATINFYLQNAAIDQNWSAWREKYVAGGLVHRCDGETMVLWRNGGGIMHKEPKPCPYAGKERTPKEEKDDPSCKPAGRLDILIPELMREGFIGPVTVQTTSSSDIRSIQQSLNAVVGDQIRRGESENLRGVEFVLRRQTEKISTPMPDGKRARRAKSLIKIEPAAEWVRRQLEAARADQYLEERPQYKQLPAHVDEDGVIMDEEPTEVEGEFTAEEVEEDEDNLSATGKPLPFVEEAPDEINPPENDEAPDLETPPTGTGALGQIYDLIAMAPDAHAVQVKRRFLATHKAERLEDVPEDKLAAAIPWFKAELAK